MDPYLKERRQALEIEKRQLHSSKGNIPLLENGGMSFVGSSGSMGVSEAQCRVHWSLGLHLANVL